MLATLLRLEDQLDGTTVSEHSIARPRCASRSKPARVIVLLDGMARKPSTCAARARCRSLPMTPLYLYRLDFSSSPW